jgi:hypothetical protein
MQIIINYAADPRINIFVTEPSNPIAMRFGPTTSPSFIIFNKHHPEATFYSSK